MKLRAVPITLRAANAIIDAQHRHNDAVRGHRFSVAAYADEMLCGVGILGRPVGRGADDGLTGEITRVCVMDDAPLGTCSFLYARLWQAWKALGGTKVITYTLQSESGASLRGAGFLRAAELPARAPEQWANRPGRKLQAVVAEPKIRWELNCGR